MQPISSSILKEYHFSCLLSLFSPKGRYFHLNERINLTEDSRPEIKKRLKLNCQLFIPPYIINFMSIRLNLQKLASMIVTINYDQAVDTSLSSVIEEDLDNNIIYRIKLADLSFVTLFTKEDYWRYLNNHNIEISD